MSTDRRGLVEFTLGSGIPAVLEYWAKVIEKTANELCNDPDCKNIQFKIDVKNLSVIIITGIPEPSNISPSPSASTNLYHRTQR